MDFENVKAQMRKGVLEFCILSILSKGDAYATDMLNKLKGIGTDRCGRYTYIRCCRGRKMPVC